MTIDLTKELADGERLQKVINANSWHNCGTNVLDINGAAAEFAAPYLARIVELETSNAILIERLDRIEMPARVLVDIDNDLAEGRSVVDKASFHDDAMRPIEKLRVYFGQIKRAEKRGQTIVGVEIERRQRAKKRCVELESRLPANSCTNAEREQYERTIDLQNARIAELGAKHKSSCEVAAEFLCATELLATKMGTVEQNNRWRAAKESLLVVIRGEQ